MTTKNLAVLGGAAAALCGAAVWMEKSAGVATPSLTGRAILPAFSVSDVARVEVDGAKKLALSAGAEGWTVDALHGYPADSKKIMDELIKLRELKAGPRAAEITNAPGSSVTLKDAAGKVLARLEMGEARRAKPKGQMAMFGGGGYPDGRYVAFEGTMVLVNDSLDAFDGDGVKWVDRTICRVPSADVAAVEYRGAKGTVKLSRKDGKWALEGLGPKEELDESKTYSLDSALGYLDLTGVADPKKTDAELGFATGAVYVATLKNGSVYTATLGGEASGGDRWLKVSASFKPAGTNAAENAKIEKSVKEFNEKAGKWVYSVGSYNAGNFTKERSALVKAKEEPKKAEAKIEPAKAPEAKKAEPKKAEPKKAEPKKDEKKK